MKLLQSIILALITLLTPLASSADERQWQVQHLTTADGLAGNYVYEIAQDRQGFIWIAGTAGLSIFDGYHVRHFTNIPFGSDGQTTTPNVTEMLLDNKHQLLWVKSSNYTFFCHDMQKAQFVDYTGRGDQLRTFRNMAVGPKGNIWLYQDINGVRRVQYDGTTFHTTDYSKANGRLPFSEVRQLCFTPDDGAWLTADGGIVYIDPNGKAKTVATGFKTRRCIETGDNHYLFFTSNNEVLVGNRYGNIEHTIAIPAAFGKIHRVTGSLPDGQRAHAFTNAGTLCVDLKRKTIERSTWPDLTEGLNYGTFASRHVVIDRHSKLTILDYKGHTLLSRQLMSLEEMSVSGKNTFHIAADHEGNIYIASNGNGLFVYEPQSGKLSHHLSTDNNPIITTNELHNVMVDRNNNVWIATKGAGITRLTRNKVARGRYLLPNTTAQSVVANMVRGIFRLNQNRLLVTTYDGNTFSFEPQTGLFQHLSSYDARVYSHLTDSYGHQWTGTHGAGIYIDDTHYKKAEGKHYIGLSNCNRLVEDKKRRIWIAARDFGLKMIPAAREYDNNPTFASFLDSNASERAISDIVLDSVTDRLWVATQGGLFMVDTRQKSITTNDIYSFLPYNSPLPSYNIISLCVGKNELWCGIQGGGVVYCRLNDAGTCITACEQMTVAQGLPSNNVNVLAYDLSGNVWAGTESGLARIDKQTHNVNSVNFSQRIADNYFIPTSSLLMPDGRIYFGTNGGLLELTPKTDTTGTRKQKTSVFVTDFAISGKSIFNELPDTLNRQSIINERSARLSHNQNSISIFFSTLQPARVEATTYQYYLEGHDHTWQPQTHIPRADYQRLEPGCYVFHAKALVDNVWSEEQTLTIHILPPWYRTWWAYLIYLCLAASIGLYIYRQLKSIYKLRQNIKEERRQREMQQQLTDYKICFFTNVSHEFRTPLTIIRGMVERLKQQNQQGNLKQPLDTLRRSTERMTRLVNQLLEFRKMQEGKLHLSLREADIVAYIQNIYMDFHEAAEEKGLYYDFHTQMHSLSMPFDTAYIDKIMYNLIANAFKYTPKKGEVVVALKMGNGKLTIEVSDSGVGVPSELRQHLFDRYMESSRLVKDSLGIGLTLTGELVRTHHGSITYEARDGGGSIFTVTLPATADAYEKDEFIVESILVEEEKENERRGFEQAYREMLANPLNQDVTVLVVEDDGDVAAYIEQILAPYFKVVTASNGEEALTLLETQVNNCKLVVSDVLMPLMDGFELTARLRKSQQWRHIPIILLTALTNQDKYIKGITQGADLYLPKPFSPTVLVAHSLMLVSRHNRVHTIETSIHEGKTAKNPQPVIGDIRDKNFIRRMDEIITSHISEENLSVETITDGLGIGRSKLFEKTKQLLDMTPRDYILKRRMEYAVELLKENKLSIAEIAYKSGFSHPPYFTRIFKKYYGMPPSEYIKQ